jgi:hypothetical protein
MLSMFDDLRTASEDDIHIYSMLDGLATAYNSLDCTSHHLPPGNLHGFQQGLASSLVHYRWLHVQSLEADLRRWHEVPKHHYAQHIILQSVFQNPRWAWCYSDESFMNTVKRITEACLPGTKAHRVARKFLQKWAFGTAARLSFKPS